MDVDFLGTGDAGHEFGVIFAFQFITSLIYAKLIPEKKQN